MKTLLSIAGLLLALSCHAATWVSVISTNTGLAGQGVNGEAWWADYTGADAPSPAYMGNMYPGFTNLPGVISLGQTLPAGAYSVVMWARPYGTAAPFTLTIGDATSALATPSNVDYRYPWQERIVLSSSVEFSNLTVNVQKSIDPSIIQKLLVWGAVVSPDTNVVVTKFNEIMRLGFSGVSNLAAVTAGNVLFNSSFELGLPAGGWWNETWNGRTSIAQMLSTTEADHGTQSAIARYRQSLRSRLTYLRPDQTYTLSFRAKGSTASTRLEYGLINATTIPSGFTNPYPALSRVYIGTSWTTVTLTNAAWNYPSPAFYVNIGIEKDTPTAFAYIDSVQLEEGNAATTYAPKPIETKLYITNSESLFYESDTKNASLRVANFSGSSATVPVRWSIRNTLNESVATGSANIYATNGGTTEATVSIDPAGQFGHFSATVDTWGSESETVFAVVRDPFTGDPWSSVVGAHPTVLNDQLYATTSTKLNPWARLVSHAGIFAWDKVEITDGVWTWDGADYGVAALTNAGAKVLGTLYERPAWVSAYPDQTAWVDYVSNVVTRYSSVVDVWEIDNEPQYQVTAAQYATMLSNAVVTIKAIGATNRVAAFGGATETSWVASVLAELPANWITNCDVAAVHMYPGGESKSAALVAALSPVPVWNTEGGSKTKGGQRSLDGNYVIYEGGVMGWEDSGRYHYGLRNRVEDELHNIAWCIGYGVQKQFRYDARLWANDFDHQWSSIESDDSIRPIGVMAAVADWMLRGLTNRAVLGSSTSPLFAFDSERGPVAIAWSASIAPRVRTTTLSGKYRPVDPFGNVGAVGGNDITVSYRPSWLLSTNITWADWTNGLAVADSAGSDTVAPNVSVIGGWDGTISGVYPVRFVGIDNASFPGYTNNGVRYRTKIDAGSWSDWALPATLSVTSASPFRLYVQAIDDAGNTNEVDRYFGQTYRSATANTVNVGTLNIGQ